MKKALFITGILFLNCCCVISLYAQQPAVQTKANAPTLSHKKLQQLIWQSPAPHVTFSARDLVLANDERNTPVHITWMKADNSNRAFSTATQVLSYALAVGSAFTPYNNVPANVSDYNARYYRLNSSVAGKALTNTLFGYDDRGPTPYRY